ncbi:putative Arginosuccinase [Seiridium unicorne]|uniref:Arginosuccinase n=1 Tax=Seiridium unicorne TaxID=138068 RepID=A0ABR2UR85_9PEZI
MSQVRDRFYWLNQINKASTVINIDENLLSNDLGLRIAQGISKLLDDGSKPGGPRPGRVITLEPLLIEAVGIEATRLHVGRSSQDMHTTATIATIREQTLYLAEQLHRTTSRMVRMAEEHADTLVPNYTNGVAAQPNSYGHYLLGHVAGLLRDAERLQQFYMRLDRSPMGTTVLNGTRWPLNRKRIASYLGFSAIADNAYDAVQISSTEMPVELGSVCTGMMLHAGSYIQDVMTQYAQPRPWILLKEGGDNTYVSSAMPQKRNPGILNSTRAEASRIITLGFGRAIQAHNITPGMIDVRSTSDSVDVLKGATSVLKDWFRILGALQFNRERALEELNSDWTASQEVADVLMIRYDVPFRVGHHFVSEIVTHARQNDIRPSDFPYEQAQKLWVTAHEHLNLDTTRALPMSYDEFKETLDPAAIVQNRATTGGPQPAEMERMLKDARKKLKLFNEWISARSSFIETSLTNLETDFEKVLQGEGAAIVK